MQITALELQVFIFLYAAVPAALTLASSFVKQDTLVCLIVFYCESSFLGAAKRTDLCNPTGSSFCQSGSNHRQTSSPAAATTPTTVHVLLCRLAPQNLNLKELTLAFKQGQGKSSRGSIQLGLGSWIHAVNTTGESRAEC